MGIDPHIPDRLADEHGVGWGAAEKIGAEILQNLNLPLGVAGGNRQGGRPHVLGTIMQPQAAGEQAVAVGDVDDVLSSGPGGVQRSGRALGPHVDVVPGIPHHRLFAGGAGEAWIRTSSLCGTAKRPKG